MKCNVIFGDFFWGGIHVKFQIIYGICYLEKFWADPYPALKCRFVRIEQTIPPQVGSRSSMILHDFWGGEPAEGSLQFSLFKI